MSCSPLLFAGETPALPSLRLRKCINSSCIKRSEPEFQSARKPNRRVLNCTQVEADAAIWNFGRCACTICAICTRSEYHAALRQKDRKAASCCGGREYTIHARMRSLVTKPLTRIFHTVSAARASQAGVDTRRA